MSDRETAARATLEPTDEQLQETLRVGRQRVLSSAGSSRPSSTASPIWNDSMPSAELSPRTIDCPSCKRFRQGEVPSPITQRRFSGGGADLGVWIPRQCEACNTILAAEIEARGRRREAMALRSRLERSGLPRAYITGKRGVQDLDAGPATDGYRVARDLCARLQGGQLAQPWLWLWSAEAGTFKTTLACCTLVETIKRGANGQFANAPMLFEDIRATYAETSDESERDVLDPLRAARWLVLDDLGVEKPSRNNAEILYRIVNRRYESDVEAEPGNRGAIFTSNAPIAAFLRIYATSLEVLAAVRLERRLNELTTEVMVTA